MPYYTNRDISQEHALGRLQSVSLELSFRSVLAPLDNERGPV